MLLNCALSSAFATSGSSLSACMIRLKLGAVSGSAISITYIDLTASFRMSVETLPHFCLMFKLIKALPKLQQRVCAFLEMMIITIIAKNTQNLCCKFGRAKIFELN